MYDCGEYYIGINNLVIQGSMVMLSLILQDSRDFTNRYNTVLTPEQAQAFNLWATNVFNQTGKDPRLDMYDYDMQGAFLEGIAPDGNLHWSDKYKKPNHPTFSKESIYNGADGYIGGEWIDTENGLFFDVAPMNMYTPQELMQYMRQVEPDVILRDNRIINK